MHKTTIQITDETLERLKMAKNYPSQTYDETINFLIDEVDDEELSAEEIKDIREALKNVGLGKTKPIEQVAKELGIALN